MMEPVRLVIWDLDGVFWRGTLSEGGMDYSYASHDIVIALARRGIISSICSKNDYATVKSLLEARGIWDYVVFPSIAWQPKGSRVAALIAAAQLRPESVLLIDDEPANRAEAAHYAPGLQTAGPALVPDLLADPRCAGAADPELERLARYRLLDRRSGAAAAVDNLAFLRASDIRVTIDYDVEGNIDRAIELTNRTNQLNFTKNRLPENAEAARAALRARMRNFGIFTGLVRVADRHGDYGTVGFVNVHGRYGQSQLVDFCFSCRILNMGVERFLYRWLNRPTLLVVGEVATDVMAEDGEVDWISFADGSGAALAAPGAKLIDRLVVRGGCDLAAMMHYLGPLAHSQHAELNTARDGRQFRIDNAMLLNVALAEPAPEARAALRDLGYVPEDWRSALAVPPVPGARTVWILSFWADAFVYLYRHRSLDLALPFLVEGDTHAETDVTFLPEAYLRGVLTSPEGWRAFEALQRDFYGIGPVTQDLLEAALHRLLAAAQGEALVMILLPPESWRDAERALHKRPLEARLNRWIRAAVAGAANVEIVDFADFTGPEELCDGMYHYDRLVYARAATHVTRLIEARFAPAALTGN